MGMPTPPVASLSKTKHRKNLFPDKLYAMLQTMESSPELSTAVSWLPHGKAFRVWDRRAFIEDVVPRFFRATKIRSFERQLHLWGFQRITSGCDSGAWWHKSFVRDSPNNLREIACTRVKSKAADGGDGDGTNARPEFDETFETTILQYDGLSLNLNKAKTNEDVEVASKKREERRPVPLDAGCLNSQTGAISSLSSPKHNKEADSLGKDLKNIYSQGGNGTNGGNAIGNIDRWLHLITPDQDILPCGALPFASPAQLFSETVDGQNVANNSKHRRDCKLKRRATDSAANSKHRRDYKLQRRATDSAAVTASSYMPVQVQAGASNNDEGSMCLPPRTFARSSSVPANNPMGTDTLMIALKQRRASEVTLLSWMSERIASYGDVTAGDADLNIEPAPFRCNTPPSPEVEEFSAFIENAIWDLP